MFVLSNRNTVAHTSSEDEVSVLASLMTTKIVVILRSFGSLEDHEERLNHVVSMHVDCQINNLHVKVCNNFCQDSIILNMEWSKLEPFHLLERSL